MLFNVELSFPFRIDRIDQSLKFRREVKLGKLAVKVLSDILVHRANPETKFSFRPINAFNPGNIESITETRC